MNSLFNFLDRLVTRRYFMFCFFIVLFLWNLVPTRIGIIGGITQIMLLVTTYIFLIAYRTRS